MTRLHTLELKLQRINEKLKADTIERLLGDMRYSQPRAYLEILEDILIPEVDVMMGLVGEWRRLEGGQSQRTRADPRLAERNPRELRAKLAGRAVVLRDALIDVVW
jgi:hypothetical protein